MSQNLTIEIKICGLSTPEAIETCHAQGADLLGFIFFEKSPRHITTSQARVLSEVVFNLPNAPKTVAVTVNADNKYLDQIVEALKPDFLQLHGSETPQRVDEVKQRYGLATIKAFAIREAEDFTKLKAYEGIANRFLLDAKAPAGSELPGGNGVSFDWRLLAKLKTPTPWMLSGGLNADSIGQALAISNAKSIDISSGVEVAPGEKDLAKITAFIQTVRNQQAQ